MKPLLLRCLLALSLCVVAVGCKSPTAPPAPDTPQTMAPAATQPVAAPVAEAPPPSPATRPTFTLPTSRPSIGGAVSYLASDELQGRGLETEGINKAADYIAARFGAMNLKPPPEMDDYRQTFPMTLQARPSPESRLTLGDEELDLFRDFSPFSFSAEESFAGPVVFAGYGMTSAEHNYDDYANLDVKGKVVLAMRFEPHSPNGKSRFMPERFSDDATFAAKARVADEHGAVALLMVTPPQYHGQDVLLPPAAMYPGSNASIPVLQITQRAADELLKAAGAPPLSDLQRQIDETVQPGSRDLPQVQASGEVKLARQTVPAANVAAVLPGRGPRADEYIVVGAHYDHLGTQPTVATTTDEDHIFNGADDNASGTAAMLDIAERLSRGEPLQRSVLFIAFTAEEQGLIGSKHFLDNAPVPPGDMVAMLNLDMVGRSKDRTVMIGGSGTADYFESMLAEVDAQSPVNFFYMGKGGYGPSDHMTFALRKIPVLFFFTGLHDDYHRPSDEAEKVNVAGIEQIAETAATVVRRIAAAPRAAYVAAADAAPSHVGAPTGAKVTLGVVPDYGNLTGAAGVPISGVAPDSAADKAGLLPGDAIVKFDQRDIGTLEDLSAALREAEPGQTVPLTIRRGGQTIETTATFVGRKGQ